MLGTVIAAAGPSKVPFYIAGGVLVIWAIALAGLGLSRPSFPFDERGARGVMSVSFVLVVATLAAAIITE